MPTGARTCQVEREDGKPCKNNAQEVLTALEVGGGVNSILVCKEHFKAVIGALNNPEELKK